MFFSSAAKGKFPSFKLLIANFLLSFSLQFCDQRCISFLFFFFLIHFLPIISFFRSLGSSVLWLCFISNFLLGIKSSVFVVEVFFISICFMFVSYILFLLTLFILFFVIFFFLILWISSLIFFISTLLYFHFIISYFCSSSSFLVFYSLSTPFIFFTLFLLSLFFRSLSIPFTF